MRPRGSTAGLACRLMACLAYLAYLTSMISGLQQEFAWGEKDPPTCEGKPRENPFHGECGRRMRAGKRVDRDTDNVRIVRDALHSGDIVGGREAFRGEFPWYVDLGTCGATIINEDTLLSAAHCFPESEDKIGSAVVAGSTLPQIEVLNSFDLEQYCGVQIRRITKVIVHPDYCSEESYNAGDCDAFQRFDFALIKVNRAFVWDWRVQPVCLPDQRRNLAAGTMFTAVGNGYTDLDTQQLPHTLQAVDVPLVDQQQCRKWMEGHKITNEMICAGFASGGRDACVGDSGGPLFLMLSRGDVTLFGVVSWGIDCAQARTPGIYARVDAVLPWIRGKKIRSRQLDNQKPSMGATLKSTRGVVFMAFFFFTLSLCHG